jgi:uncharacterized protein (TIGR02466 family)
MKKNTLITTPRAVTTISVFPTLLHASENFLDAEKLQELAESAQDKADVNDDALKSAVLDFGLSALAAAHVDLEHHSAIELTEIWYNVLQSGDHHWDHTHANHILSGVIYLTQGCYTIFSDPRPAASVLALTYKDALACHTRSFIYRGACNSIVVFPSWLPHRVATSPKLRKTIAFNLMLRGLYGDALSREQVIL